ncbi:hypothetical protein [Bdellovibrio sp. HCB209]|uniref:hypothetical protein n=1 Tax=Bdellovibrio sp. HCB209 TaxID=3394354 RepID=UPI0039B46A6D
MKKALVLSAVVFAFSIFSSFTLAQETKPDHQVPETCFGEVKQYCEAEPNPSARMQCLMKNFKNLTYPCQQEINRIVRAVEQAQAQSDNLISPNALTSLNPPFAVLSIDGRHSPGDNQQTDGRVALSVPVVKTNQHMLTLKAASGIVSFEEPLPLSDTATVPKTLYKAEAGAQYSRQLPGFRNYSISSTIGYTGDQTMKNATFSILANYGAPTASGAFLMWNLFISNNSPLGNFVPIPGIMYMYKTPTFTGLFGIPAISLQWTPSPEQAYSFSFLGPTANVEAAYGRVSFLQTYVAANWSTQSYILENRVDDKDRLYLEEKKVGLGIRSFVFGRAQAQLEGGYAFDRAAYSGDGIRNMKEGSKKMSDATYVALSIKAGF